MVVEESLLRLYCYAATLLLSFYYTSGSASVRGTSDPMPSHIEYVRVLRNADTAIGRR